MAWSFAGGGLHRPPTSFSGHPLLHLQSNHRCSTSVLSSGKGPVLPDISVAIKVKLKRKVPRKIFPTTRCIRSNESLRNPDATGEVECVGTGLEVECLIDGGTPERNSAMDKVGETNVVMDAVLLVSPFFFWGTAMVAMKEVLPHVGPFAVASFRLVPAGILLVAFAALTGRPMPSGFLAWLSISVFALIDGSCFQGFLAEGLQRTSAGLGSVIIDSQPLTVAVLAAFLFGESIGYVGAAGLVIGVIGLLLLELPALSNYDNQVSLWGSGEWWMLLAAQSMAVGTIMVRWVSKYSDPVMATGWHMIIGGLPLVAISIFSDDPVFHGGLDSWDIVPLLYASIFGGAVSYGLYFYNATKGSLTKLSSLTFLTPMFASMFGFLFLGETFTPVQLVGGLVTVIAIYMVNFRGDTKF